jgi:hypothetical protein
MAEEILAHAQIGWAAESALVSQTMATSAVAPQYGTLPAADAAVEEAWAGVDSSLDEAMQFCGGQVTAAMDIRTTHAMAVGKTDLMAHAMRQAEGRAIALNDRRFSQQLTVIGLGRGTLAEARSMGQLGAHKDTVRNALLGTINSAVQLFGYQTTRWQRGGGWTPGQGSGAKLGTQAAVRYDTAPPQSPTIVVNTGGPETVGSPVTSPNVIGTPLGPLYQEN